MDIAANLQQIQSQITDCVRKAGREAGTVSLIAVSKTKPIQMVEEAWSAGQVDFGENRPQALRDRFEAIPDARWHMIGTLQRNKIKYIAADIHLIHSVDSAKLLYAINKEGEKIQRVIPCLLQLNISEEDAKHGLDETRALNLLQEMDDLPWISIHGLMGMASFTDDTDIVRAQFQRLRLARDQFDTAISHERVTMTELSMGMSGDYEIAIEEGATMVRVGSAIFGQRG